MDSYTDRRHNIVRIVLLLAVLLSLAYMVSRTATVLPAASAPSSTANSYSTNFSHAENPISEGGKWISGKKAGLDWADVRVLPGFAYGLEIGGSRPEREKYDDSTALLTGKWGPDQTAEATVHRTNKDDDKAWEEVELRLRSKLGPHNCTGYEVMFRCSKSPQAYCNIARWDGILGAFMMLQENHGAQYGVADGDVIKASIKGEVITIWLNGKQIAQTHDYLFTDGNPGIGFYIEGAKGVNDQYGLSKFSATSE